jgi:glycine betaine transporter
MLKKIKGRRNQHGFLCNRGYINNEDEKDVHMFKKLLGNVDYPLFLFNIILFLGVVWMGIFRTEALVGTLNQLQGVISTNFGGYYSIFAVSCLIFSLWCAFGPYGHIKLGQDHEEPEYSNLSWFAMLFSCGIGLGFIFWGVAEPLNHYMKTPYLAEPATPEAASVAMQISYLHWGLHPWSMYVAGGLGIAYFSFRLGQPMTMATGLYGLLGDRIYGFWGRVVNFLAAFASIGGVTTMMGLGILSINFGITHVTGIEMTTGVTVFVLALFVAAYISSAVSGLQRGIKYLSNINILLAILVVIYVFLLGPTRFLIDLLSNSIGHYFQNFIFMSFWTDPVEKTEWLGWWTVFYWAFWVAWTPFVGGFIARISRGRTIREYVIGGIFIPTAVLMVCFVSFGGSSIYAEMNGVVKLWEAVSADYGSGIFTLLQAYPLGYIASIVIFVDLITFLITSADSGAFLVAMVMSKGELEPKAGMKIIWGIIMGALSIVLLVGGGLKAVQSATIIAGLPYSIVMIAMMVSLVKGLKKEPTKHEKIQLDYAKSTATERS